MPPNNLKLTYSHSARANTARTPSIASAHTIDAPSPMPIAEAMPERRDTATAVRATYRNEGPGLIAPRASAPRILNNETIGSTPTSRAKQKVGVSISLADRPAPIDQKR